MNRGRAKCMIVVLIAVVGLLPGATAFAEDGAGLGFHGETERSGRVQGQAVLPQVSTDVEAIAASSAGVRLVWVGVPVLASSGDPDFNGGVCRGVRYVAAESAEAAAALRQQAEQDYQALWSQVIGGDFPGVSADAACPTAPAEQVPSTVLRDAVRESVVDQLPRPALEVPPGWALTGMPAFLVTNHRLGFGPVSHTIDLGEIIVSVNITATGETWVDWGDGTVTTHAVAGMPWPDGQVVHTYRDAQPVTVTVTDRWVVDFTVTDPVTISDQVDAVLDPVTLDLEVRQIQAVRVADPP